MTLILKLDLDIVITYFCTKNEVNRSICSKVIIQKHRQIDRQTHRHVWNLYLPALAGGNDFYVKFRHFCIRVIFNTQVRKVKFSTVKRKRHRIITMLGGMLQNAIDGDRKFELGYLGWHGLWCDFFVFVMELTVILLSPSQDHFFN